MSDTAILQFNEDWRLATDYRDQWILQRRHLKVWGGRRYHVSKSALMRSILELVRPLDFDVAGIAILALIDSWPEQFQNWLKAVRP